MIPELINICGIPYKVIFGKNDFEPTSQFGQIIYTKGEIMINPDMPKELQMQTLIHEWVHGALVMLGFNDQTQNEQFVQALSAAINMSFKLKEE